MTSRGQGSGWFYGAAPNPFSMDCGYPRPYAFPPAVPPKRHIPTPRQWRAAQDQVARQPLVQRRVFTNNYYDPSKSYEAALRGQPQQQRPSGRQQDPALSRQVQVPRLQRNIFPTATAQRSEQQPLPHPQGYSRRSIQRQQQQRKVQQLPTGPTANHWQRSRDLQDRWVEGRYGRIPSTTIKRVLSES